MRLGLTGGIGCGKSTFGQLLESRGWRLIRTDLVAREILNTPPMIARMRALFGDAIIGADGHPDRAALAKVVFADKAALATLEAELHPPVQAAWRARIASAPEANWVVEIPLLFEKSLERHFDFTVCVHCSPAVQLNRLAARGLPEDQARARISAQLPMELKLSHADVAVFNDGDLDFLTAQANHLTSRAFPRKPQARTGYTDSPGPPL